MSYKLKLGQYRFNIVPVFVVAFIAVAAIGGAVMFTDDAAAAEVDFEDVELGNVDIESADGVVDTLTVEPTEVTLAYENFGDDIIDEDLTVELSVDMDEVQGYELDGDDLGDTDDDLDVTDADEFSEISLGEETDSIDGFWDEYEGGEVDMPSGEVDIQEAFEEVDLTDTWGVEEEDSETLFVPDDSGAEFTVELFTDVDTDNVEALDDIDEESVDTYTVTVINAGAELTVSVDAETDGEPVNAPGE